MNKLKFRIEKISMRTTTFSFNTITLASFCGRYLETGHMKFNSEFLTESKILMRLKLPVR